MAEYLFWFGLPTALLLWIAGLPALLRGEPAWALCSAGSGIVQGIAVVVICFEAPIHSLFWLGHSGDGDGFGVIGLILFGAGGAGCALLVLLLTAAIAIAVTRNGRTIPPDASDPLEMPD